MQWKLDCAIHFISFSSLQHLLYCVTTTLSMLLLQQHIFTALR